MIADFIIITILILFFVKGYSRGIIIALFSFLSLIIGLACALKLSGLLSAYFIEKDYLSSYWAPLIAYMVLFIGVIFLVRLGAKLIDRTVSALALGLFNKLAGGLVYSLIVLVIISCVLWLADKAHLISPETMISSRLMPKVMPVAPYVFSKIGTVWPFFSDLFADLQSYFDQLNTKMQ